MNCPICNEVNADKARTCWECGGLLSKPTNDEEYYDPNTMGSMWSPFPDQVQKKTKAFDDSALIAVLSVIFSFNLSIVGFILSIIGLRNYHARAHRNLCTIAFRVSLITLLVEMVVLIVVIVMKNVVYVYE